MKWLIISSILFLSACCTTPELPDPTVNLPTPPEALMQPGQELKTIQDGVINE